MTTLSASARQPATRYLDEALTRSQSDRFDEALQPRLMGPRLAAALAGGPPTCHVLDAKYEPAVRAIVLYEHAGRLVRGDLLSTEDDLAADTGDPGRLIAPGIWISRFPHDPQLPALPRVMDAALLGPALAEALHDRSAARGRRGTVRCRVTLLRYRPGKRATVRVVFVGESERYVAKAYHDPVKAAAVAGEASALASCTTRAGTLRFAPTVAHLPGLAAVVQRSVRATPLEVLIGTSRRAAPGVRQALSSAARALAELHAADGVSSRQRSVERELLRFGERGRRIGGVDPQLGAALDRLAARLTDIQNHLPAAGGGVVHGDCKPSQFLVSGRHAYLLDLDHVGVSDQAADVGTFLASLRQLGVRRAVAGRPTDRSNELASLSELFLTTYLEAHGCGRDRTRVRWHEAVALERKALRAFARAPRSPLASALVTEAHRCLDRLTEAT